MEAVIRYGTEGQDCQDKELNMTRDIPHNGFQCLISCQHLESYIYISSGEDSTYFMIVNYMFID